jgi:tetratricopeptide (TPR) repeat protein
MRDERVYDEAEQMYKILDFARQNNRKIESHQVVTLGDTAQSHIKTLVSMEYLKEVKKESVWFYSIRAKGLNLFGKNRMKGEIPLKLKEKIINKLIKDLEKLQMKPWEVMLHIFQLMGKNESMNTEEITQSLKQQDPELKGTSRANIYRIIQRLRMKGYIEYDKMVYTEQSSYTLGKKGLQITRLAPSEALNTMHSVEEWDAAMKEVFTSMKEEKIQKEEALFSRIESIPEGLSADQLLWILYLKATTYELKERLNEAEASYLQMEGLSEEIGDVRGRSYSLKGLGTVAFKRAKYAVAEQYFRRCQNLALGLHDDPLSSDILNNLGSCSFMNDDVEGALDLFTQALELVGSDRSREAMILCNQGLCYARMEQLDRARALWEESLHLYIELHDTIGIQTVQHNLREIDCKQKREYLEETYRKAVQMGTTTDRERAYEELVRFHFLTYLEKEGVSS